MTKAIARDPSTGRLIEVDIVATGGGTYDGGNATTVATGTAKIDAGGAT